MAANALCLPRGPTTAVVEEMNPVGTDIPFRACQLIISNLVSNAVKYTPAGSTRVTLWQEGAWAVLTVQDTGIGISPGEICHLFSEFFRASNALAGGTPGTGLGLAAVKALVESWNGEVELQSQENQGTRFTVRLPPDRADIAQEAEARLPARRYI
jgi:signal transduction histidine kinase